MEMMTLPVAGYWVTCQEDEDYNEEFGAMQLDEADEYLNRQRGNRPDFEFQLVAVLDA